MSILAKRIRDGVYEIVSANGLPIDMFPDSLKRAALNHFRGQ